MTSTERRQLSIESLIGLVANCDLAGCTDDLTETLVQSTLTHLDLNVNGPEGWEGMIGTYQIRLDRSRRGEGPVTCGLAEFVKALRAVEAQREIALVGRIRGRHTLFQLLLDSSGTGLLAVTGVDGRPRGKMPPAR